MVWVVTSRLNLKFARILAIFLWYNKQWRCDINQGFFIAKKQPDGTPGRPVGNEEGAIMLFEDLEVATRVKDSMVTEHGPLSIFKVNLVFAGEVLF